MTQISKGSLKWHLWDLNLANFPILGSVSLPRLVIGWVRLGVATLPDFSSRSESVRIVMTHWHFDAQKGSKFSVGCVLSINTFLTHLNSPTKIPGLFSGSFLVGHFTAAVRLIDQVVKKPSEDSLILPDDFIEELRRSGLLRWLVRYIKWLYVSAEVNVCASNFGSVIYPSCIMITWW